MPRKVLILLFILLLLGDTGFSFWQHYRTPLDGDMAGGIVPESNVTQVLNSPLGFDVWRGKQYANPNLFVSHWSYYHYFNEAPILLQRFTSPIDSAYLACAIAKILIQLGLLWWLALNIAGPGQRWVDLLLAMALLAPLFQTNGYRSLMGVIDAATTHTFFYALPALFLIIYFTPLLFRMSYGQYPAWFRYARWGWIPLALLSSLSGHLNPGISLIWVLMIGIDGLYRYGGRDIRWTFLPRIRAGLMQMPRSYYFFLLPIGICSLYALLLSRFNILEPEETVPLWQLYARLPKGLFDMITPKAGWPILIILLIINGVLIKKQPQNPDQQRALGVLRWGAVFVLLYILLLPLGGYREYRPNVVRYDTMVPATLAVMFMVGKTSLYLLKQLKERRKYIYTGLMMAISIIFTIADEPKFQQNTCQKAALEQIANSSESVVHITDACQVLNWNIIQ
ncbi:MAG: hypothetical protein AAFV07_14485, partial [Bacteroidota bacterium]